MINLRGCHLTFGTFADTLRTGDWSEDSTDEDDDGAAQEQPVVTKAAAQALLADAPHSPGGGAVLSQ